MSIVPQTPLSLALEEIRFTWAQDQLESLVSRRFFGIFPPKFKNLADAGQWLRVNVPLLDWEMIECAGYDSTDIEVFTYCVHADNSVWDAGDVPAYMSDDYMEVEALNPEQALRYVLGTTW